MGKRINVRITEFGKFYLRGTVVDRDGAPTQSLEAKPPALGLPQFIRRRGKLISQNSNDQETPGELQRDGKLLSLGGQAERYVVATADESISDSAPEDPGAHIAIMLQFFAAAAAFAAFGYVEYVECPSQLQAWTTLRPSLKMLTVAVFTAVAFHSTKALRQTTQALLNLYLSIAGLLGLFFYAEHYNAWWQGQVPISNFSHTTSRPPLAKSDFLSAREFYSLKA